MKDSFERAASLGYIVGIGLAMVLIVVMPGRWSIVERIPVLLVGLIYVVVKAPVVGRWRRRHDDDATTTMPCDKGEL